MESGRRDTYQEQLHGELNGVAVEGNAYALVDSQSHHSGEEEQDAGGVGFGESDAVVNYVLKEENIAEASLGIPPGLHGNIRGRYEGCVVWVVFLHAGD